MDLVLSRGVRNICRKPIFSPSATISSEANGVNEFSIILLQIDSAAAFGGGGGSVNSLPFILATFFNMCMASSTRPRVINQLADSGINLSVHKYVICRRTSIVSMLIKFAAYDATYL